DVRSSGCVSERAGEGAGERLDPPGGAAAEARGARGDPDRDSRSGSLVVRPLLPRHRGLPRAGRMPGRPDRPGRARHPRERAPDADGAEQPRGARTDPALARRHRALSYGLGMLTNRSAPPVTITPVLTYPDVRAAVAWLESAFGFEERVRIGDAHRAQLRVGSDGAVVLTDTGSDRRAPGGDGVTHLLKVRVPDVDEAFS